MVPQPIISKCPETHQSLELRLNLAMASRAHLLEPHWNPMVEAQAAGRIDRLDQNQDIVIYHYIVKQSIEEVMQHSI